jgi:predicted RecB family nuclease
MSSPEQQPPGPSHPGGESGVPPITREILEAYLNCKYKGYLKLIGQRGTASAYEVLATEVRKELRERASEGLVRRYRDEEILRGPVVTPSILGTGPPLILDAVVEDGEFSLEFDALKRVDAPSGQPRHHYIPILVFEGEKVRKEHRQVLEVYALALGRVQGVEPKSGVIIHGRACRSTRVHFKGGLGRAARTLEELSRLAGPEPPPLALNDHCQVCEFRRRCLEEARAKDDISLLRGLNERAIKKLKKKGITTVTQLSCTFRPRKETKRELKNRRPHSYGLQAMAIRDGKTYVYGTPELPPSPVRIYLDLEGDPDRNLVYLIGMIIDRGGEEERHSFWADDEAGADRIFREFLDVVGRYDDCTLFFYGRYEADYLRRMRAKSGSKKLIDRLLEGSVNVLRAIYGKVYFPVYSNGLKDVAAALGFSWSDQDASGIMSLVWRRRWERGDGEEFKVKLLRYNLEDCAALKRVTEVVGGIVAAYGEPNQGTAGGSAAGVPWSKATVSLPDYRKWSRVRFACPDYDFINKCSHFEYQRQRVHIRTGAASGRRARKRRRLGKPRISQRIRLTAKKCPECGSDAIFESDNFIFKKLVYDLRLTVGGIKRWVVDCQAKRYRCRDCDKRFLPRRFKRLDRFSHNLKSWAMYLHIAHEVSFPKIETLFRDMFGLDVDHPRIYRLKVMMATYYSRTTKAILGRLMAGGVIYADETEVKLKKTKGYVWVLSNTEEVLYLYRPSREVDFLKDLLRDFTGVLVTDFYPAYDTLDCLQQKCLIHLIRDLNGALLHNPGDDVFKRLAFEFGKLLRSIVTTIDGRGLKRRHLAKHRPEVDRFYREIIAPEAKSEAAIEFRGRFLKHREKLFQFLDQDGVSWNNNFAEHAVKHFAKYRNRIDGNMNETGLESYLTLLSVYQTCNNKGVSLLKFFVSGERDIDAFRSEGRKKRRPPLIAVLPERFYIPWQGSSYFGSPSSEQSRPNEPRG